LRRIEQHAFHLFFSRAQCTRDRTSMQRPLLLAGAWPEAGVRYYSVAGCRYRQISPRIRVVQYRRPRQRVPFAVCSKVRERVYRL
jgi:hypothetical protein